MGRRIRLGLAAMVWLVGSFASAASPAPHILLIVADDLGFTDLGAYGSEIPTPNLDRLAAGGTQLLSFYANASCTPSRAMLLSGLDNHAVGYGANPAAVRRMPELAVRPGYRGAFPPDLTLLPGYLKAQGYGTYFVGKWHLGGDPSAHPPARGFDHSLYLEQGGGSHFSDALGMFSSDGRLAYRRDGVPLGPLPDDFFSTTFYVDEALRYLEDGAAQGKPVFLQLSLTAPHWPLQALAGWRERFEGLYEKGWEAVRDARLARLGSRFPALGAGAPLPEALGSWSALTPAAQQEEVRRMGLYAAMIAHLDQELGRLLDRFAQEARPVAVVFLSDNGPEGNDVMAIADNATWVPATFDLSYEAMGKRGSYVALGRGWGHVSAGPLNRYKSFLSEGGTRTPAILSYPGVVPAGLASNALVAITDLLPTLVAWAGGEVPKLAGVPIDAERLAGAPRGQPLAMEIYGNRAVWDGPWKALWDFSTDHWQLFHLPTDPGEQRDRSGEEPARLATMVSTWDRFAEENQVFRFPRETGYGRYADQRPEAAGK